MSTPGQEAEKQNQIKAETFVNGAIIEVAPG